MAAVMAAVVCGGRAFSGGAAASATDDVGGGCDGAPRPFGCCVVMIARAHSSGRFSTVGPVCQRQTISPAVNARGAHGSWERGSPRSINRGRGRSESLTSPLSIRRPCFFPFLPSCAIPWLRPRSFCPRAAASLAFQLSSAMAPRQPIVVLEPLPWTRSTVTLFALNELVNGGLLAANVKGAPRRGSSRRRRTGSPTRRTGMLSASSGCTSAASPHRRATSCGACTTTMGWSSTTSPPTRFRRRLPLLASARGSWGS
jgi:hypothetical protein